jgi:hypothetical protein
LVGGCFAFFGGGSFALAFCGAAGVGQLQVGPTGRLAGIAAGGGGAAFCDPPASSIPRATLADCPRNRARSRSRRAVSVRSLAGYRSRNA